MFHFCEVFMRVFFILMFIIIQIFADTLNQISQSQAKQEEDRLKNL